MRWRYRLWLGPLAAAIFAFGVVGLALAIPGYSQVRQTVSEIGEVSSPMRLPFAMMLCCVAACILIFASAVRDASLLAGCSPLSTYVIGAMAVSAIGIGVFAYPHPLHNAFGISELVGYQAPLVFAVTWRRAFRARTVITFSWVMFGITCVAIALNLSSLDRQGVFWSYVRPVYGLAQRALFAAWFVWCTGAGALLFQWDCQTPSASRCGLTPES